MADINSNSILGGGALPMLAPDLNFPSDIGAAPYLSIALDASSGLTTAISLSGKFSLSYLYVRNLTAEMVAFKLTIDGVVIWDSAHATSTDQKLIGGPSGGDAIYPPQESYRCNASLLFEVQTAADTEIVINYMARPIL